jgi:hypothetical protein
VTLTSLRATRGQDTAGAAPEPGEPAEPVGALAHGESER